jgi:hypothetical protein
MARNDLVDEFIVIHKHIPFSEAAWTAIFMWTCSSNLPASEEKAVQLANKVHHHISVTLVKLP